MANRPYRVGIVGASDIAAKHPGEPPVPFKNQIIDSHVACLALMPQVELVGICDLAVRRQNKWDKRGAFKACNLDANRLRQFSDLPTSVRLDSFASPPVSSPVWRLAVRGTYPPA